MSKEIKLSAHQSIVLSVDTPDRRGTEILFLSVRQHVGPYLWMMFTLTPAEARELAAQLAEAEFMQGRAL